jgi:hypothetical protein
MNKHSWLAILQIFACPLWKLVMGLVPGQHGDCQALLGPTESLTFYVRFGTVSKKWRFLN